MDAGDRSPDPERGGPHPGRDHSKLGQSAMAGGAQSERPESGRETLSSDFCNSLPLQHDARLLLQSQA